MRVERFDYALPPELVAQAPTEAREAARLMLLGHAGAAHADATIADLPQHVAEGTLIVVNDTRVLRARILGVKEGTGGRAEIFLVKRIGDAPAGGGVARWRAMGRASKPLRPGTRVVKGALVCEVVGRAEDGLFDVDLSTRDGSTVDDALRDAGQVPLPPYIKRAPRSEDEERYQTVFARVDGAVAAPTAGLHLTEPLLKRLEARGCEVLPCTLHVGLGTFQPVTVEDLDDHPMHAEYFEVSRTLASAVARVRERGGALLAIGTTVVRALESARDPDRPGHVLARAGETRLLVQPGYRFAVVDRLLTNLHLPRSTLLAMVCAFGGTERVLAAYARAVRERYRFFSYGDAMLVDRDDGGRP